jgi:glycosyltransferase involved in cell wall biosynthesis
MADTGSTLAIVSPSLEDGGAEQYIRIVAAAAARRGWTVHAGFPARTATERLRADLVRQGIVCHALEIGSQQPRGKRELLAKLLSEAALTRRMVHRAGAERTLLVLPHPDQAPGAVLGTVLAGGRLATSVHLAPPGLEFTRARRSVYTLARRAGLQWIAVSGDNRRRLAAALHWREEEIALVYNGVADRQPPAPDREALRQELRVPPDAKLLLTTGRLNYQKGHDLIIASIPQVLAERRDVWWVWAGEGPAREALTDGLRQAGIAERVRLLGRRDDVPRLLAGCDLFVFPSRYEGFPLALLEAQLARLPVIASDAGSLPEVVRDHREGRLARPGELAPTTLWALDHPEQMGTMAAVARQRALDEFSEHAMCDATLSLLSRAERKPSGSARLPGPR